MTIMYTLYTFIYNTTKGKKAFKKEGMKKTTLFFKQYFGRVKKNAISEKGDRTLLNRFSMCSSHNVTRIKRERRFFFSVSGNLRKND